jgi:hypothetical protein
MAKPKIAGKEGSVAHGLVRDVRLTIATMYEHWQAVYPSRAGVKMVNWLREADANPREPNTVERCQQLMLVRCKSPE